MLTLQQTVLRSSALSLVYSTSTELNRTSQLRIQKVKVAQTRYAERRVPELVPVLGSQPAGDVES